MQKNEFKKVLGFFSLVAAAVGIVVSQGTIVSVLKGVALGQINFIVALIIAALLSICYSFTFSELSLMIPGTGGINAYSQVALGHFPAIVATLCGYVVVNVLGVPAELQLLESGIGQVLKLNVSGLGLFLLVFITILNILGIDFFSKIQNVFSFSMIGVLALIGINYFIPSTNTQLTSSYALFSDFNITNSLTLVTLALWAFLGVEFICSLTNESKNPQKHIPKAMKYSMLVILILYLFFSLTAMKFMSKDILIQSSLPHFDLINKIFGKYGYFIMLIICVSASSSTINSIMSSIPRMMHGMAKAGQLPSFIGYIHPKFKTPVFAILILFGLILIPLFTVGKSIDMVMTLLVSASTSWLATYVIGHISLISLRKRYPDINRPYKSPFYPLPQILGSLGMIYVFFNSSPTPELTKQIYCYSGISIFLVSIYAILWVKLHMKQSLFQPIHIKKIKEQNI